MFKRLSLYTLLLCFVPIFAWLFAYHWQGDDQLTAFDHFLGILTETGSTPYALITCVIFPLLFYPLIKQPKQWIYAVMIMATSMVITQGLKSGLKTVFAEPRPYIVAIANNDPQQIDYFYQQDRNQRAEIVQNVYQQTNTPSWLVKHRMHETGYSFPSGHSIFAASWLMLAVGFAWLYRQRQTAGKILVGFISLWAILMLVSRLRLGMHYPIDLLISTLIALPIHGAIFAFIQRKGWFKS